MAVQYFMHTVVLIDVALKIFLFSTVSLGHYYNFIRCAPNEWYKFDDEKVDYVQEDLVLAEQAYILFYTKRGTPLFSEYIQSHIPFVWLVNPTTSNGPNEPTLMPKVNNVKNNVSHG
uniref:USP domain-containing protein n=1 Tax=Solanum lycopersicum TaxID=4081 RepID=A0A3Q7HLD3_SOLLC